MARLLIHQKIALTLCMLFVVAFVGANLVAIYGLPAVGVTGKIHQEKKLAFHKLGFAADLVKRDFLRSAIECRRAIHRTALDARVVGEVTRLRSGDRADGGGAAAGRRREPSPLLQDALRDLVDSIPVLRGGFILEGGSRAILASTDASPPSGTLARERGAHLHALPFADGSGDLALTETPSESLVVLEHPIRDDTGRAVASVLLEYDFTLLLHLAFPTVDLVKDMSVLVVNETGDAVAASNFTSEGYMSAGSPKVSLSNPCVRLALKGEEGIGVETLDGETGYHVAYRYLPLSPSLGWAIIATMDRSGFFAGLRGEIATSLLVMLAGAALVVAFTWLVTKRMLRPLEELRRGAVAVAGGNLEVFVPAGREDELGALAGAFNEMVRRVKAAKEGLAGLVRERTADLESANRRLRDEIETRSRAEEGLRASEGRFRLIADHMIDLIWTADISGRYTYASPSLENILGYRQEDFIGRPFWEGLTEGSSAMVRAVMAEELAAEERGDRDPERTRTLEVELVRREGTIVWAEVKAKFLRDHAGRAVGFQGATRDITERRRLRERIVRSEEQLRTVFDTIASGVLVTDGEGRLLLANRSACGLLGIDCPGRDGAVLSSLVPGTEVFLEETGPGDQKRIELLSKAGSRGRVLGYTTTTMPSSGHRVTVFRDLTPIIDLERRRQRAEQLAQIGVMAAKVSHEIKNPLSTILSGMRLLERQLDLDDGQLQLLNSVVDEIYRISEIAGKMLSSAKPRIFSPSPVSLSAFMRMSLSLCLDYARERSVDLKVFPGGEETRVVLDQGVFRSVVENLLHNAVEASPAGGEVRVSWRSLRDVEAAEIFPGFPLAVICLRVEDDGPGIAREHLGQIFTPYFTTKKSGTGLGLATSLEIVESHGGVITAEAREAGGSTFTVFLPSPAGGTCYSFSPQCGKQCREGCEVRGESTGYCCWAVIGQAQRIETGRWPDECRACPVFLQGSLQPYLCDSFETVRG